MTIVASVPNGSPLVRSAENSDQPIFSSNLRDEAIQDTGSRIHSRLHGALFGINGITEAIFLEKLRTCDKQDFAKLYWQAADALELPIRLLTVDGKPAATPGIVDQVLYISDCFQDDTEALGRTAAISSFCWGSIHDGRIRVANEVDRKDSPSFNIQHLGFSLASHVAQKIQSQIATNLEPTLTIWIGNAAVRDKSNPEGTQFYLAHLKGNVLAIVTGTEAFSRVKQDIVGGLWQIDIKKVITAFGGEADIDTHFRSRYLEGAAKLFLQGMDILTKKVDIPDLQPNLISPQGITTTLGHVDGLKNLKFGFTRKELEQTGWQKGQLLSITINGVTKEAYLNGAISEGSSSSLILTVGSTFHQAPGAGSERPNTFVDAFVQWDKAAPLFKSDKHNPHNDGLPLAGDVVEIRPISN